MKEFYINFNKFESRSIDKYNQKIKMWAEFQSFERKSDFDTEFTTKN